MRSSMVQKRTCALLAVALFIALAASGAKLLGGPPPDSPPVPVSVAINKTAYTISGPCHHENLAVYFLETAQLDDQDFITLDEGLKSGVVKVSEMDQASVSRLVIENESDKPLYIQEGDRLVGGKQDRIMQWSLVVPPKSGKMPVPAFCVEQSRWHAGAGGKAFGAPANSAFAPNSVRLAGKYSNDQTKVWSNVADLKDAAAGNAAIAASKSNSSLTEALDSTKAVQVSDAYVAALGPMLLKHPDAVGVVLAVNGKFVEADIYPSHKLLTKLYPRLVAAYAIDATLAGKADYHLRFPPDVAAFLTEGSEKSEHTAAIDSHNQATLRDLGDKQTSQTTYNGQEVQLQWMAK